MDNVKFKSSVVPTSFKATEYENGVPVPSEGDVYQTTESDVFEEMKELYFGKSAEESAPLNPFATLAKAESVPFGYTVDPVTGELVVADDLASNPYYIPTLKVLTDNANETDVPLTIDALDKIKENYAKGLTDRKAKKAELEATYLTGGLSPSDADMIKQQINYLDKAIQISEDALKEIEEMKKEVTAMFQKEMDDLKKVMVENNLVEKFNSGSTQDKNDIITEYILPLDHGDLYLGDPNLKIRIVDTNLGKALRDDNSGAYILRFSASGLPVSDKAPLPTEPWEIAGSGLMNTGITAYGDDDSVFEIDDAMPREDGLNLADAKVQFNVPEFITVRADESGEPIETTGKDDGEIHYVPAGPDAGSTTVSAPTDPGKYTAVRITKVTVESAGAVDGEKTDRDGYDMIYKFWAGEYAVAYQVRVTGKNGSAPASDYAHAIVGPQSATGEFLPITIDAIGAKFTGRHMITELTLNKLRDEYEATEEDIKAQAGEEKSAQAISAFNETMDKFKSQNIHVNEDSKETTGIIISGRGHFIGAANANNLYFVKSPKKLNGENDPLKTTIIENGGGLDDTTPYHNAVFAKGNGDVFATNVTLAHIKSEDKKANIGITMKPIMKDEIMDGDEKEIKKVNAKLYASIMGSADNKWIYNGSDTTGDDKDDIHNGDDYFYSTGKEIAYSDPAAFGEDGKIVDPDASSDIQSTLDFATILDQPLNDFNTAVEGIDLDMENPYDEIDTDPNTGEYYTSIKDVQQGFYDSLPTYFGYDDSKSEEVDTSDIENPEKEEEKKPIGN